MSFADGIRDWNKEVLKTAEKVFRRAVELEAEEMTKTIPQGGDLPFLTGNLSRSFLASTSGLPKTAAGPFSGQSVGIVTAKLKLTEAIWLGYQARYARRMEYGFIGKDSLGRTYSQGGHHFVQNAIDKWPSIVDQAIKEVGDG